MPQADVSVNLNSTQSSNTRRFSREGEAPADALRGARREPRPPGPPENRARSRSHRPVDGLGDAAALGHQALEGGGSDGLGTVAGGPLGVFVDLNDQAVGPGGHGGL